MSTSLRRRTPPVVWLLALATAVVFAVGGSVAWRKFRPSAEQEELARYVELEVPVLLEREAAVRRLLDRLAARPGPSPDEARRLLVDDAIPRLVALRRLAASITAGTPALTEVNAQYLRAVDALIEACRTSVRTIDDPAVSGEAGLRLVQQRFAEASSASRAWEERLRLACERAGFQQPGTGPRK